MKRLFVCLLMVLAAPAALAKLGPETVSTHEFDADSSLVFQAAPDAVVTASKDVFAEKKWKLLYEGAELPKKNHGMFSNMHAFSGRSGDKAAWEKATAAGMNPRFYLQAKTPTSAFSFGAELFVVVYESPEGGSLVSIVASTSQALEKKKMRDYIASLASELNMKLGSTTDSASAP